MFKNLHAKPLSLLNLTKILIKIMVLENPKQSLKSPGNVLEL